MPLDTLRFSPLGASARSGNAPAIFSYMSEDSLQTIRFPGYFNELRGDLRINDWIYVVSNMNDANPGLNFIFINSDGSEAGLLEIDITIQGSGYAVNDVMRIELDTLQTDQGLIVVRAPLIRVSTIGTNGALTGVEIIDPGEFLISTLPNALTSETNTGLVNVPMTILTGAGIDATFDCDIGVAPDITTYAQDIVAD